MGDVDAVRKLVQKQATRTARSYANLLKLVRAIVPDCDLTDMGSFHLLRVACALRQQRSWQSRRARLNKLLAIAGNEERLPELPDLEPEVDPDTEAYLRLVRLDAGIKTEVINDNASGSNADAKVD